MEHGNERERNQIAKGKEYDFGEKEENRRIANQSCPFFCKSVN